MPLRAFFFPTQNGKVLWSKVAVRWSVGMVVSTPIVAIVQGSQLLYNYRTHHADAPYPSMPARGVAVSIDNNNKNNNKNNNGSNKKKRRWYYSNNTTTTTTNEEQLRPLRILVIGDSLAAGVGMSKSGSPILPESIARALSQALNGRMVYWTCVGTPGISAAQIVQDIHDLDDKNSFLRQPSNRLESFVNEWQEKRNKFLDRKELRRRLSELQQEEEEGGDGTRKKVPNALKEWWQQIIMQSENNNNNNNNNKERTPSGIRETTTRVFGNWWNSLSSRVKEDLEVIKEDLEDIKDLIVVKNDDKKKEEKDTAKTSQDDKNDDDDDDDDDDVSGKKVSEQYDIAVVLTGLNDIKETFLPHMNRSTTKNDTSTGGGGGRGASLSKSLDGVLQALKYKMQRNDNDDGGDTSNNAEEDGNETAPSSQLVVPASDSNKTNKKLRLPLIVVPELPIAPLPLFHLVPLKWFLIPLFRAMEEDKRLLSSRFPDYVVFIHQPDMKWWEDVEAGFGPIRENLRQEQLLFHQTDIAQRVKDRIQELMKEHYNDNTNNDDTKNEAEETVDKPTKKNDHNNSATAIMKKKKKNHHDAGHGGSGETSDENPSDRRRGDAITGSSYVAADNMHPNDEGYELWGRHIAAAIVEHWDQ